MKIALLLLSLLLCSCSRSPSPPAGGGNPAWLTLDKTREVGMHVLLNRYPQAQIVSELGEGRTWTYRFATNGTLVPLALVVDRKAGKARFEKLSR